MSEKIEINGVSFDVGEDSASAELTRGYTSDEVFVPLEINGMPVKKFYYSPYDTEQAIKYIKLPASIEEFVCNHSVEHGIRIEIDENNPTYFTDSKAVYTKNRSALIRFFAKDDEEYTILDGCKKVLKKAFENSKKLKRVTFPDGLELICEYAFCSCAELAELDLPNGLVRIEGCAFEKCEKIERLTLPSTLECVDFRAFEDCRNPLTVHLPDTLSEIDFAAFPDSWTFVLGENSKNFISRDGFILSRDGQKIELLAKPPENGLVVVPEYITEISPYAFYGNKNIEKVVLPRGLCKIGQGAFEFATHLLEINLEYVKEIGDRAFENCISLKKINLNCNKIGSYAFSKCYYLAEAEVDCERTGNSMFRECANLQKVVLKHTKILCTSTFFETEKLKEIVFPPELEEIESAALARIGTRILTIPKTVRRLGHDFADCVREIHIYDNIESDISEDDDISKFDYTLYVHSADTDEVKYAVQIIGNRVSSSYHNKDHKKLVGMFNGGTSFDFDKFDSYFSEISDYYTTEGKLKAGLMRLKYAIELDGDKRREYEDKMNALGYDFVYECICENKIKKIMDHELYTYISLESLLSLVDLAAEQQLTELTAFLMQKYNEKRIGKQT